MLTRAQIVDKTIMEADLDQDGKISFEEFQKMVEGTDVSLSMTLGTSCARTPGTSGMAANTHRPILVDEQLAGTTCTEPTRC